MLAPRSFATCFSFGGLNRAIRCSGFARGFAAAKNELGSVSRINLYARINSRSLIVGPSDLMNLNF